MEKKTFIQSIGELAASLTYYIIDADYCAYKGYTLQGIISDLKEDISSHQPTIFSEESYLRDIEIINSIKTN